MTRLEFDPAAEAFKDSGIRAAMADQPDFEVAHDRLLTAREIVWDQGDDLVSTIYCGGRIANDLGVVEVRKGLYAHSHEGATDAEALDLVRSGLSLINGSYTVLNTTRLARLAEVRARGWEASLYAEQIGTMNTLFRATQSAQLLAGKIGLDKKADDGVVTEQRMLGRGTDDEPGAWAYHREADNGYYTTQTPFLGTRGERINGGLEHNLKAIKWWAVRGIPELAKTNATDPRNRKQATLTAGRLTLESLTRSRAIAAALDYQRF